MNAAKSPRALRALRHPVFLTVGLLALGACAAYRNTLTAPFVLDDGGSITDNTTIHQLWPPWQALNPPRGGFTVSGRPLMNLTLAVNYAISGEAVWSYHLLNLVIHFLAACALFGLVRRTLALPSLRWRFGDAATSLAAAIAGLWLLHPLQTEAVTYVSQRTESLAGLFLLVAFYAFARSFDARQPLRWRWVAVAACLFGAGTKEILATAPLLLLLYDRTFVTGTFRRAWVERREFYVALTSIWLLLAVMVAGTGWDRGGTAGFDVGVSAWGYWCTQFDAIVQYVRLSFWPNPLIFDHGTFWMTFREALPFALLILPLLVASVVAIWRWPAVGFLGAWFFVILAPTSLVPGTIQMVVEHRMYLPLAAVITLIVTGCHAVFGRRSQIIWPVMAVAFGVVSYTRNEIYASDLTLWRDTAMKAPGNAMARYSLGIAYSERGQYAKAVDQGEAALSADVRGFYAAKAYMFHNKLGHDLVMLGRMDEAVTHYARALQLNPNYAVAHLNLARAFVRLGRYPEAIVHYDVAVQRHFGGAAAEMELSDALMHERRVEESITHLRAALHLMPRWAPGWNNLGYALLSTGEIDASIAAYREAVRLDPQYAAAFVGLGYALISSGRPGEAIAPCREAVRLQPRFADAHNTLGIALAQTHQSEAAVASFEQALRIDGTSADVHSNLGNVLSTLGRPDEAIAQYREAVRLDPEYAPAQRYLGEELRRAGRLSEAAEHLAAAARLESASNRGPQGSPRTSSDTEIRKDR